MLRNIWTGIKDAFAWLSLAYCVWAFCHMIHMLADSFRKHPKHMF